MENRREKGAMSIEAALILAIFLLGYTAIISAASFIRAQMIIQYSISQAAKEMSSYCYLVSKTGIMDDSHRLNGEAGSFKEDTDKVIDTVVKLYDAIDSGSSAISGQVQEIAECTELDDFVSSATDLTNVTQDEFNKMNSAATNMMETGQAYFSNPKQILKGIASLAKDGALSAAKSYIIAAPISRAMVKKQIDLYPMDSQGRDVLERLGVVDGMKGLNFTGSSLFNDGETITVQVSYSIKIPFPGLEDKPLHFIQKASTRAWGAKEYE